MTNPYTTFDNSSVKVNWEHFFGSLIQRHTWGFGRIRKCVHGTRRNAKMRGFATGVGSKAYIGALPLTQLSFMSTRPSYS